MDKRKRNNELVKIEEAYLKLAVPKGLDPVEQTVWAILARASTPADATQAWNAICKGCIDVNEIRVSKVTDLAEVIEKFVKGAVDTADEARGFLRRIFLDHFRVDFQFSEGMEREKLRKYLVDRPDHGREVAMGLALKTWSDWHAQPEAADGEGEGEGEEGAAKSKKPTERELDAFAMKMRMLLAVAAQGKVTAKSRQASNPAKGCLDCWSPASGSVKRILAAREARKKAAKKLEKSAPPKIVIPEPAPPHFKGSKKVAKKAPPAKKVAPKAPAKKAPAKKVAQKAVKKAAKKAPAKKAAKKVAKKAPAKKKVVRKTAAARRTTRPRTARARPRAAAKKSSRR